jgi:hypothetical protein
VEKKKREDRHRWPERRGRESDEEKERDKRGIVNESDINVTVDYVAVKKFCKM